MEVRQFERAVRDAEGKLAQVRSTKDFLAHYQFNFRLLNHSTNLL